MANKFAVISSAVFLVLVWIVSFYFLSSDIQLNLVYYFQQPLFLTDSQSFLNSFRNPGELLMYIGTFVTALYNITFWGEMATLLALSAIPVYTFIRYKNTNLIGRTFLSASYILFGLLCLSNYTFNAGLLVLLNLTFFAFEISWFIHSKLKQSIVKAGTVLLFQFLIFWLLGGLALLLFSSLFLVKSLQKISTQSLNVALLIGALYMAIPYLMVHLLFQMVPLKEAYFSLASFPNAFSTIYFWILVLFLVLYSFIHYLPVKTNTKQNLIKNAFVQVAFLLLLFFIPQQAINKTLKEKIKISLAADNQQWDKVLQSINPTLIHDPYLLYQTNRALYFSKGLLTNLFHVPQYFGSKGLLLEQQMDKPYLLTYSDFYFDLGFMNESRHWAHEAFTRHGMQPNILKQLTLINLTLEKYNTAQKYLTILKKSLNDKAWAMHYEKYLSNPSLLKKDRILDSKHKAMPKSDFFVSNVLAVDNLRNILSQGENKMAFEYLLAAHLLNHELVYVVNRIPEFKNYGYKKLPRAIQEALVLYLVKTHNNTIPMADYTIDQDVINQFKDYSNLYRKYRTNEPNAKLELEKKYSQTMWYYIHFISPLNQSNS